MRIDTYHQKEGKQWVLNVGSTQFQFYLTRHFKWYRVKPIIRGKSAFLVFSFFGFKFIWGN